jgi:hypothetical protein
MASLRAFERELKVATAGLEPQAINKLLAQTAHQALEEAQSAGEAPESFIRYVNGREGVAEESVEAPGPIVYVFSWLNEVAPAASAELIVTNDQPYHRKIDTGHMRMSVPPGIVEDARQAVMRRFGNVIQAQRRVITLGGAYVLAGVFHQGYRPHARTRLQKDTAAGRELNYPALVISQRF